MQDKKKKGNIEDIGNLKSLMSLNDSLLEMTKNAIKNKNNDIVFKMMDSISERPELWTEYLSVSILNQNFPVAKYLVEKFNIDVKQSTQVNAIGMSIELSSEIKTQKQSEIKENYLMVECPWIIQAAIGGDIDIFNYLLEKGASTNSIGHIVLSRKHKNSVISNILGAASAYGRVSLLHYILEKYPNVQNSFRCIEKKAKIKQFNQIKEFSDFTPVHLSIVGDFIEEDTIEILKYLKLYGADFSLCDSFKNNVLHLASKFNKFRVIKFMIEDLKLNYLVNNLNKDGLSSIAISDQNAEIVDYLQRNSTLQNNENYDELVELLQNSNVKKKKGKKNKNKKDEFLINSTEFQETLKLPQPKVQETDVNIDTIEEKVVPMDDTSSKSNENEHNEQNEQNEQNDQSNSVRHYERRSYYPEKINRKNNYKISYDYYKGYSNGKNNSGSYIRYNDRNYNDYTENSDKTCENNTININYDNINEKYNYHNTNYDYQYDKKTDKNIKKKKHEKQSTPYKNVENIITDANVLDRNIFSTNIKENAIINKDKILNGNSNELHDNAENEIIGLNKKGGLIVRNENTENETINKTPLHIVSENNIYRESYNSLPNQNSNMPPKVNLEYSDIEDEDFLKEDEPKLMEIIHHETNILTQEPSQMIISGKNNYDEIQSDPIINIDLNKNTHISDEFKEITAKYLELEKSYEKEKKERFAIENYYINLIKSKKDLNTISTENNIISVMKLANEELEKKSKLINELQSRIDYLENNNLETMNEYQLNQLKNFYGTKLSSIVSAISNLK